VTPSLVRESASEVATAGGNDRATSREHTRASNLIGDTTWCEGTVVSTDEADGTVTVQVRAINQRNEITATGEAVVELPRRGR
jgi:hypothetical protein